MKTATASGAIKNFHLPLPPSVYEALRDEAAAAKRPITALAREIIEAWLRERQKMMVRETIAAYAAQHAGSAVDLDRDLEAASLDVLRGRRRGRR
jgi:hypothetical protein